MTRLYKTLLKLYPREFSQVFAAEMLSAFEGTFQDCRRNGAVMVLRFVLGELIGLARGVSTEWCAKTTYSLYHSSSYISKSCLPDRILMRPAGVARELYFAEQSSPTHEPDLIDESGICGNAHQRFVLASPLRRLLMLTCALFLPIH